jgi:CheY-like chemotaxis protein
MPTQIDLPKHLRQALNHLYNPEQLRKNPLIEWFGFSDRYDAPASLQTALTDAIQALRPGQYEPIHSEARQTYEILLLRYIQQFNQQEVAHHIGVSERQFRREQDRAINVLADFIWKKFGGAAPAAAQPAELPASVEKPAEEEKPATRNEIDSEWGWLEVNHSERIVNTPEFIQGVLNLIRPVADQYQTRCVIASSEHLPDLAVHSVAARQILLNLLRVAIAHAGQSQVTITTGVEAGMLTVQVESHTAGPSIHQVPFEQEDYLLQIAAHLTRLSKGQLSIENPWKAGDEPASTNAFRANLLLPLVEGISVLVVDDNADIIELIQRYTTGTRYRVTGLTDPELVFKTIQECGAKGIVLDVMMPKIDGWELLGRLRQHPMTADIPVVILSILAQEELALSLGARALIVKPVTQERFLAVLDQVFAPQS